jgi:lipopolysaccharide transport system ATP-binding protein
MFRVMPQPERLATGFVDFCVTSDVSVVDASKVDA